MRRPDRGAAAERYVTGKLARDGYQILDTNWRTRYGEVDIVALHDDVLVFVEVRARTEQHMGSAEESVDVRKLERLMNTALAYIQQHEVYADHIWRVDLIAITLDRSGTIRHIEHIQNLTLD